MIGFVLDVMFCVRNVWDLGIIVVNVLVMESINRIYMGICVIGNVLMGLFRIRRRMFVNVWGRIMLLGYFVLPATQIVNLATAKHQTNAVTQPHTSNTISIIIHAYKSAHMVL